MSRQRTTKHRDFCSRSGLRRVRRHADELARVAEARMIRQNTYTLSRESERKEVDGMGRIPHHVPGHRR